MVPQGGQHRSAWAGERRQVGTWACSVFGARAQMARALERSACDTRWTYSRDVHTDPSLGIIFAGATPAWARGETPGPRMGTPGARGPTPMWAQGGTPGGVRGEARAPARAQGGVSGGGQDKGAGRSLDVNDGRDKEGTPGS